MSAESRSGGAGPAESKLEALSQPGSEHYVGLERFPNPGCQLVSMTSDEFTAVCPITAQPDWYTVEIEYEPGQWCLESKSLKLYLGQFRNDGAFCESLAVQLRDDIANALDLAPERVQVTLAQKARGGISITALA